MSQESESDASGLNSLLIEHACGTFEIVLRRVEIDNKVVFVLVELIPMSGARHALPTHGCLGNALSMQKWMHDHPEVFADGYTSFR
jgi:hypothetical protein